MRRYLGLTDEQAGKIEVILEGAGRERQVALRECRPAFNRLRTQTDAKIDEVLTPEQQKRHAKMREQMRHRYGKPAGGPGPPL